MAQAQAILLQVQCQRIVRLEQQLSLMAHVCKVQVQAMARHQPIQRLHQVMAQAQAILQHQQPRQIAQQVQQRNLMVHVCKAAPALLLQGQLTQEVQSSFTQAMLQHRQHLHRLMVTHQKALILRQITCLSVSKRKFLKKPARCEPRRVFLCVLLTGDSACTQLK